MKIMGMGLGEVTILIIIIFLIFFFRMMVEAGKQYRANSSTPQLTNPPQTGSLKSTIRSGNNASVRRASQSQGSTGSSGAVTVQPRVSAHSSTGAQGTRGSQSSRYRQGPAFDASLALGSNARSAWVCPYCESINVGERKGCIVCGKRS